MKGIDNGVTQDEATPFFTKQANFKRRNSKRKQSKGDEHGVIVENMKSSRHQPYIWKKQQHLAPGILATLINRVLLLKEFKVKIF